MPLWQLFAFALLMLLHSKPLSALSLKATAESGKSSIAISPKMRRYCAAMDCDYVVFYQHFHQKKQWYCEQRESLLKRHNLRILRLVATIAERNRLHGSVAVLPIIESSLNARANHDKSGGAKGFWQLMPGTARDMGLTVNGSVDQRLDISKSTQAAMQYLAYLKKRYNDHNLAIMAYNAGVGRVDKLISLHGTRNPWYLSRVMADKAPDEDYLMKYYSFTLVLLGEGCNEL